MGVKWTTDQQHAIECCKGSVLVSAAAGSGKTTVLVERVIRRLTDKDNPCSAEDLLIVTFTRAATAQMREKIGAAILKRLSEDPTDRHLRRQYMLLPFAKICTIDSFCNDLVRENFHALGISPDYSLLDNETAVIMKNDVCEAMLERAYEEDSDGSFSELSDMMSSGSSDEDFAKLIIKMYDISTAYPFPDLWLDSLIEEYSQPDINKSCWGGIIKKYVCDMLDYCVSSSRDMMTAMESDPIVADAYGAAVQSDINMYAELREKVNRDWDEALEAFNTVKYMSLGRVPKGYESETKNVVTTARKKLKDLLKKVPGIMCVSSEEHADDMRLMRGPVTKLIELVKQFGREYSAEKDKMNSADFSDILHRALNLLAVSDGSGGYIKTDLARELSSHYVEILVDEYQDINEAQDMIFRAISADENNLFTVGDVKQSIYRFRQAMPEIFLRRRGTTHSFESGKYPLGITLGSNFRSRVGVTSCVNYIFRQLMSAEAGELEYDDSEALNAAAKYPERDTPDCELHVVTDKGNRADTLEAQARYVARYIDRTVREGKTLVTKGGALHPASYGDFCILLRTAKNVSSVYANALSERGIPVFSPETGGFFEAAEISFILSLLRVLDNPVQDIPLAAVMLSPLFGFSAGELADIRASAKERLEAGETEPLYRSVAASADEGDEKAAAFLKKIESLRRLSLTLSAGELVRRVCEETGFDAIVGAMPDGERRRLNVGLLCDYAEKYEAAGNLGLSGFIRFIDKVARTSGDLATAARPSENADIVRIMTVHQSKGLEFPICIFADMQHAFNERDNTESVLISSSAGLGMKRRTEDGISVYDTASRRAAVITSERMGRSEEMRVLYVALTRAKENLIMVTSVPNPEKGLAKVAVECGIGERANPFAVLRMNNFSDLVLMALMRHPAADELRKLSGIDVPIFLPEKDRFRLKVVVSDSESFMTESANEQKTAAKPVFFDEVCERLDYSDPRSVLSSVPAKRAASDGSERGINREYFASSRPAFMSSGGLTPAQRGTATHKFMQFSDYAAARADIESELARLVDGGFLSEDEGKAVNIGAAKRFFMSPLAERIFASDNVMREKKFAALFPAKFFYPELTGEAAEEKIVVQGIADCVFVEDGELVIVDYKTDTGVDTEALLDRYSAQLEIYREALSQALGMPVKETLLYSFFMNSTVKVGTV
ncbi:MAG: helicase-exonuclease AddAB subunit AddA [Oscillospiraceae bacterium]|nr:helicase-exonuclease AddAB subunit AddA [Oscillospiraceae bacterium]MDD6982943.1 helicase-exonuclease AddAB subunit AddA [Oscillospiraceae bacterium]MDY4624835.1 helicase-exonuclease AddAB subunit AddA [Oscillospiraceae bacterium]